MKKFLAMIPVFLLVLLVSFVAHAQIPPGGCQGYADANDHTPTYDDAGIVNKGQSNEYYKTNHSWNFPGTTKPHGYDFHCDPVKDDTCRTPCQFFHGIRTAYWDTNTLSYKDIPYSKNSLANPDVYGSLDCDAVVKGFTCSHGVYDVDGLESFEGKVIHEVSFLSTCGFRARRGTVFTWTDLRNYYNH
jgi:hypothetical protein